MLSGQLVGLSQEILWSSGPRLSLASESGVEEGQGQGPAGLRPGGCIEIASSARAVRHGQGSRREMGFPAIHRHFCSCQVKQRRLPVSHT